MPKISVITPVYNVEKYLGRCIDSILNQTFTDFELILVDDGSNDNSVFICDEYSIIDNRVHVIHQNNQGQASARNNALNIAIGTYIMFVDSDDYIHPRMFEILIKLAEDYSADVVRCKYIKGKEFNYQWSIIFDTVPDRFNSRTYLRNSILNNGDGIWVLWDKLIKRECFERIRFPEGRIYEDNATVYRILFQENCLIEIDIPLYYYYQNENSTMNQAFSEKNADWLIVLEEMIEFFDNNHDTEVCIHLIKRYINESVWIYKKIVEKFPDSKRIDYIKKQLKKYYRRYKKSLSITINNSPELYHIIYPKYSKAYWILRAVVHKMKG